MAIDVAQFHQVFFEESFEGLEVMESGLVDLEVGSPDIEAINAIFRAAHSIKGGSGTFGFSAISDFTHVLETLLDEMRAGKREVTRDAVDVLLLAVDSLRSMLDAARSGTDFDAQAVADVHHKLEEQLHHGAAPITTTAAAAAAQDEAVSAAQGLWRIEFVPELHLFATGNDPVRILRELERLGAFSAEVDLSRMPEYGIYDPETCYSTWRITLDGGVEEAAIREVFEWVEDDAKITLSREPPEPAAAEASSRRAGTRGGARSAGPPSGRPPPGRPPPRRPARGRSGRRAARVVDPRRYRQGRFADQPGR
jgi:two-component system chemotaxis sensor kinase CheA